MKMAKRRDRKKMGRSTKRDSLSQNRTEVNYMLTRMPDSPVVSDILGDSRASHTAKTKDFALWHSAQIIHGLLFQDIEPMRDFLRVIGT